jgi:ribonuclease-3
MCGGRERPSALADAFEAALGAMLLDGGFEAASEFIAREFRQSLNELTVTPIIENPKGELQELLQAVSPEAPYYEVVSATGPDHDRVFECTVHHGGKELARGTGKSKKAAESEAALAALRRLKDEAAANPKSETRNPKEARNLNSE